MVEMGDIKKVLLMVNPHKANAQVLAEEITRQFVRRNIKVHTCILDRGQRCPDKDGYDMAFSLGGDGTVLFTARIMAPLGVPILPVNLGTLGFIAAVHPDDWDDVFCRWVRGEAGISRRLMLEVRVERRGSVTVQGACLNDVVISASGIAKIIRLQVKSELIPGEYISLGQYRSDGLIVATPTGSTAYSVAAGGPILDPEIEAVIINPICPFTLSNRPMVVPAHETVVVEVEAEQRSGVLLTVDGQVTEALEPYDRISIRKAPYLARLIASDRRDFYRVLRTKLNWPGSLGEVPGEASRGIPSEASRGGPDA
jgi:NAD+ kinase